jgi:arginase family enzyme
MNLNDFFDSIELEKDESNISNENFFSHKIDIHTPDQPIQDISNYQLAILGVCEDRNSKNTGAAKAPDVVRQQLYKLFWFRRKLKIIDLGNLKACPTVSDTYFGLREVLFELISHNVLPIIIGGTQDITYGMSLALQQINQQVRLVNIDARIDWAENKPIIHAHNYLSHILGKTSNADFINIGNQAYYIDNDVFSFLENEFHSAIRLGEIRFNLADAEPYFRNATLASFDISSVKFADAPGTLPNSPNGFMGEEFCQLARYAGLGVDLLAVGFFEINPDLDKSNVTSTLVAQAIWYFIEGFINRELEEPEDTDQYKRYMVHHPLVDNEMVFYKSIRTGRWWMEIPIIKNDNFQDNIILPCTASDYQKACNEDIPERWWKFYQRYN